MTISRDGSRTASEVLAFLSANPDFLGEHPELLSSASRSTPAASLTTRQLRELREQNEALEAELATYRTNARANDRLFRQVREFSLVLAAARTIVDASATIATHLCDALRLSDVVVFTATRDEFANWRPFDASLFDDLKVQIATGSTLWTLRPAEYERLFGRSVAKPGSVAIAPFSSATGVLALGSIDANRFSQQQDTVFLDYTVALIENTMMRLAD